MFLRNIVNDSDKRIFINLAVLIAVVDDRYVDAVNIKSDVTGDLRSSLPSKFKLSYASALLEAVSVDKIAAFDDFFFELGIDKNVSNYLCSDDVILSIIQSSAERVVDENKNNPHIKRDVMESLLDRDMEAIDQKTIFSEMVRKPTIRVLVVKQAAMSYLESLKVESNIQKEIRKLMLFELIGLAYSDGNFSSAEREVIHTISNALKLDEITEVELLEVAGRLFSASEEAFELINE